LCDTRRLIDIAERLRNIESTLAAVQLGTVPHPATSSSHSSPATIAPGVYTFPMVQASVPGIPHPDQMPNLSVSAQVLAPGNPVMIVNDTISLIDRRGSSGADSAGSGDAEGRRMMMGMQLQSPDAILRGVLTPHECDEFFQMFFDKLQPWVMHFDIVKDASSSDMRERSPILFHTILLSTAYYLMENSDRGLDIYCTLTGIVNELIAPLIISAQNEQMNVGFSLPTSLLPLLTTHLADRPHQVPHLPSPLETRPIWVDVSRIAKSRPSRARVKAQWHILPRPRRAHLPHCRCRPPPSDHKHVREGVLLTPLSPLQPRRTKTCNHSRPYHHR
jgi:hypothetical protein